MSQDEVSVSLTIRDVSEKDSGSYTLEASNDLGSVSTSGQLDVQGTVVPRYIAPRYIATLAYRHEIVKNEFPPMLIPPL